MREMLKAICSLLRSGCAGRLLPPDLPPWKTVDHDCRLWRRQGLWAQRPTTVREVLRARAGREPQPSAAMLDRQAVKTTGVGGSRGDDGAKKRRGRKRHLRVDTHGLVWRATGQSAALQDRAAVPPVRDGAAEECPRRQQVGVDQGDTGSGNTWIEAHRGWEVEVVGPPPQPRGVWAPMGAVIDGEALRPKGFRGVLPRRWVIERTFRGCGPSRRLSKDDERLCATSAALIYATMSRLMRRRLAHA